MALREILAEFGVKFSDTEMQRAEREIRKTTKSLDRVARSTTAADRTTQQLARTTRTASRAFGASRIAQYTRRLATMRRESRLATGAIGGLQRAALGIGAALAGAAGGLGLKSILDTGANFEQAITNVAAVGLQTREQIAALETEAKRLGATTKFTATEAANAMEIMARAGFSQQDILAGVGGVLDAAAASGLEMAEVSNHVSNVLKGMGLEASEATRVADVLTVASSKTNSSIGSLGESMKNVASTARELGVPMEDTVAAVALLQDVGLDASVAGSAVNTMLTKLAAPTAGMRAQLDELGISFENANGQAKSFPEILSELSKGAKGAGGNMKQVAFLAELVGLRGQKAASNLAALFESGKVEELTKELLDAEGAAKRMAEIRQDTLLGDWEKLSSAIDDVKNSIFQTQSGPLRDLVQEWTKWVNANQALIKSEIVGFINSIRDNLPRIVFWLKVIGGTIGVFWTMSFAVRAVNTALIVYNGLARTASFLTGAQGLSGAMRAAAGSSFLASRAFGFAAAGLKGIMLWAGAAGAALGGVMLALDQADKLSKETGGLGVTGTIREMFQQGTWDPFKAVDEFQNRQARQAAKQRQRATGSPTQAIAAGTVRNDTHIEGHDQRRINVTVNLPDGTPEETGRRVGNEVSRRIGGQPSTAALRGQLVPLTR